MGSGLSSGAGAELHNSKGHSLYCNLLLRMSIPFEDVPQEIPFFPNTTGMVHLKLCKEAALKREKERGSDCFFSL